MKLAQLLREIRVDSPVLRFNLIPKDNNQKNELINSIQGKSTGVGSLNVLVGSTMYTFVYVAKVAYKVNLILLKFDKLNYHFLNDDDLRMIRNEQEKNKKLEQLLKLNKIPYKELLESSGIEKLTITLDKKYIDNFLYIEGIPFKNLI
jgi:hypothetical protein